MSDQLLTKLLRERDEFKAQLAAKAEALTAERERLRSLEQEIDNGNPFIFCDYVDCEDRQIERACVRGAGHNGPHALCSEPYPQSPVLLAPRD